MVESIKMTELQLLDMSSILSYEAIQLDRFVKELRDFMLEQKMEVPAFNATREVLGVA